MPLSAVNFGSGLPRSLTLFANLSSFTLGCCRLETRPSARLLGHQGDTLAFAVSLPFGNGFFDHAGPVSTRPCDIGFELRIGIPTLAFRFALYSFVCAVEAGV